MDAHSAHAPDDAPELAAVLAHAEWVRALARRLARDPGEAEDLAQETWLAFDARRPDVQRGLRPWLATVVRQLALRRRRDRARREAREHDVARLEPVPSSAELAADAELRALVGRALVELDEPFRSTLILRFFAGLEPAEIAARDGVPAATVRTRVKRGLDKLRAELDRRCGDRSAWSALFLRVLAPERRPPASAAPVAGGLLAMSITWKIVAGIVVLACAGALAWWSAGDAVRGVAVGAAGTDARAELETGAAAQLAVSDAADGGRRVEIAVPARPAPAAVPESALAARVHVRVVDAEAVPIAGVSISALARRAGEEAPFGAATSDVRGDAELVLGRDDSPLSEREFVCALVAQKSGFATRKFVVRIARGIRTEVGDVALARACTLRGRVESVEGAPLAGALVECGPAAIQEHDPARVRLVGPRFDYGEVWIAHALTNADGSFAIDDAAPGVVRVWGACEGRAWTPSEPLELRPGEHRSGLVLRLAALTGDETITGRVLTPEGEPFADARVRAAFAWAEGGTSLETRSDARGNFVLRVETPVPHELRVSDDQGRYGAIVRAPIQPGAHDIEARFAEPRWIEVRATSRGEPVARYSIRVEQHEPFVRDISLGPLAREEEAEHPGGIARVLAPSSAFDVAVDAPGYALARFGPFDEAHAPDALACELAPLPGLRGRVVCAGVAVDDVCVELLAWHGSSAELWRDGYRTLYGGAGDVRARPGGDGSFVLHARDDGRYVVRARVTGERAREFAAAELGPLEVVAQRGADGLELHIGAGGTIEGRVIVDAGENPAGRIVGLNHGDGEPRTVRTDAEGRFRVEHLASGDWQVLPAQEEVDPTRSVWTSVARGPHGSDVVEWTCKVADGAAVHVELDVREHASGALDGRVQGLAGSGWSATLEFAETAGTTYTQPLSANVANDGRFHFEFARAGSHVLRLVAPGEPGRALRLTRNLVLAPGANSLDERVEFASLRGEGCVPVAAGVVYEYAAFDVFGAACRIVPDAQGRFEVPLVLAGDGAVNRYVPASKPGDAAQWETIAKFAVAPGAEFVVRLP